jgi:hypothetical protein
MYVRSAIGAFLDADDVICREPMSARRGDDDRVRIRSRVSLKQPVETEDPEGVAPQRGPLTDRPRSTFEAPREVGRRVMRPCTMRLHVGQGGQLRVERSASSAAPAAAGGPSRQSPHGWAVGSRFFLTR